MTTGLDGGRVLVTGAGGQLGRYLRLELEGAGAATVGVGARSRPGVDRVLDITDSEAVRTVFAAAAPAIVIHAAAFTDVDGAERDEAAAYAVNATGSGNVARAATAAGAYLIGVSTDFVFAGDGGAPYDESAPTGPLSAYGRTKLRGEEAILQADAGFAVARTSWLYGGAGKHFPRTVLSVLRHRGGMEVVDDEFGSPTFAGDLAAALVQLVRQRPAGIFHLANEGRTSRYELARAVAATAGWDADLVTPTSTERFLEKYPLPARRPADSTLANVRAAALGFRLPPWRDAVDRYGPSLAAEFNPPSTNKEG